MEDSCIRISSTCGTSCVAIRFPTIIRGIRLLQLDSLKGVDNTVFELLYALSHILVLVLTLQVKINHRYFSLVAPIFLEKLIFQFFIQILLLTVFLLNYGPTPLGHIVNFIWLSMCSIVVKH